MLFAKKPDDAARFYSMTGPQRRAAFAARIAMQRNTSDAESLYQAVIGQVTSDPGLMMDRMRFLRGKGYDQAARDLAARQHKFLYPAADPGRFYDMLLTLANDAAQDRQWTTAFNITSHLSDVLPAGTDISQQPIDLRDNYTSLVWLGGMIALDRTNQPGSAVAMFYNYARGGHSLQVQTKGNYWAGRAALAAGRFQEANDYFQRAAAYPELFYGQLALERLGKSVSSPPQALPQYVTTAAQRAAFNARPLVQAVRLLGQQGRSTEEALFIRALAESLDNDSERNLAVELGQQINRQDLPVWVARMARVKGSAFYVRQAYPTLPATVSGELWSLAHGISRQESSFDPYAVSHAGARGMMQLMTGTAREQAGKMGVGFDSSRLISDPSYNVMIGSSYFQRMLNIWGGNVPLAVASYNAGSRQRRQMGPPIWRPARPGGRAQVDRGDPLRRNPRIRAAGDREQRGLRFDARQRAATIGDACLALLGKKRPRLIRGASWPTHRRASSLPKVWPGSAPNMTRCSASNGRRSSKSSRGPRRSEIARKMPIIFTESVACARSTAVSRTSPES